MGLNFLMPIFLFPIKLKENSMGHIKIELVKLCPSGHPLDTVIVCVTEDIRHVSYA